MQQVMRNVHGAGLEFLGKTLILTPCLLLTADTVIASMFSLFVQFFLFRKAQRAASVAQAAMDSPSLAHDLMEIAYARAGRDPHHSAELRAAALASLSCSR